MKGEFPPTSLLSSESKTHSEKLSSLSRCLIPVSSCLSDPSISSIIPVFRSRLTHLVENFKYESRVSRVLDSLLLNYSGLKVCLRKQAIVCSYR
jgi:hypothetical protein